VRNQDLGAGNKQSDKREEGQPMRYAHHSGVTTNLDFFNLGSDRHAARLAQSFCDGCIFLAIWQDAAPMCLSEQRIVDHA
jgi:hypothetical protein